MKHIIFGIATVATIAAAQAVDRPHIVVIYTDDMGIGDLSCYNNGWVQTPNIDRIAHDGIRFERYYSASPVSSPSRVSVTTGMFPIQWGINTYLDKRMLNARREQVDYLDPAAPTIAHSLKAIGYHTAHIGKWHMGGGRDVDDAPQIPAYGFDEYVSTYESPDPDKLITASNWIWSEKDSIQRWERTSYFVDRALDFLSRHKESPCFVNLWPDDMHDPWIPESMFYTDHKSWVSKTNFEAVLCEYDRQIGRFVKGLKDLGIWENTLLIFTSDNGALPTFQQARTNGLRGSKISLYEGGVRMPFLISWPARIKGGQVNTESVICSVDLYPSLCAITGAEMPDGFDYSGEDRSTVLTGKAHSQRSRDIMWDYGRSKFFPRPPEEYNQSPSLAILQGNYKLLVNPDGSQMALYDVFADPYETTDIARQHPELCKQLSQKVTEWYFNNSTQIKK